MLDLMAAGGSLGLSEWAVGAVGTDIIAATSIAHDGAGGALVTGWFSGEASFGSTSLQSLGEDHTYDVFVMHVMASGAIDWAVRAGGTSFDLSYGIAHDGAGGALVTGYFNGEATFGSTSFEAKRDYDVRGMPSSDIFVMHVTASGAIDWAVQAGGPNDEEGSGIACDGAGGALVTGYFAGTASFGNTSLASGSNLHTGRNPFVMHVSAAGAIDWAVQGGCTTDAIGTGIAYDGAGGALVSGLFSGEASFGSTSFDSRGKYDVFVMHVTASGTIDWAVQAGGPSFDQSNGIAHSRRQSQLLRRGLHDRPVREGGHRSSRHRSSHASDPRVHSRYETRPWAYWRVDADPEPDALTALLEVQEQFGRCRVHHDVHHRPRDNELPDECHAAVTQLLDFGVERSDLFSAIELKWSGTGKLRSELGLAPRGRLLPVLERAST